MPLDPQVAAMLARAAASGQKPRSAMTIEETRAFAEKGNANSGAPLALASVAHSMIGGVPARIYQPHTKPSPATVLFIHGGRFISGSLNSHDSLCRELAASSGCRLIAVDYRLAPEHCFPAALDDCIAAASAIEGPLVVCGDSAGGNLAAAAALQLPGRFLAQVLVYPMLDATCSLESHVSYASGFGPGSEDMQRGWREYGDKANPRDPRLSPLWAERLDRLPPALVISAEYDSLRDEAEVYADRMISEYVEVELRRFPGAIHGFFQMAGVLEIGREAVDLVGAYVRSRVSSAAVG